ncbi:MAG: tetratricopeptide repeat protein, partial [Cyclobacteriaceae bacterium]|nr:tetratricopeptide repeat protein [Cyclobacteriaceae bacterium]
VMSLSNARAFQSIDSLKFQMEISDGTEKVDLMNALFREIIVTNPSEALNYALQGIALAEKLNYEQGKANSLNNAGVAYKNLGIIDRALEVYIESLGINEKLNNREGMASNFSNIGAIYSLKNDNDNALDFFTRAYEIVKDSDDKERQILALNNLGNVQHTRTYNDLAREYYTRSIALCMETGLEKYLFDPLYNLGNIYFLEFILDSALMSYSKALEIARTYHNRDGEIYAITNIGKTYSRNGEYKVALDTLTAALVLADSMNSLPHQAEILYTLAYYYYDLGYKDQAFVTLQKTMEVNNALARMEANRKIEQMQNSLNNHMSDYYKKEILIDDLQLKNSRSFVIIGMLVVLLAVGGLFTYLKIRALKSEQS